MDVQVAVPDRWFSAFWLEIAGFSLIDAEGDLEGFVFPMGPNGELPKTLRLFRQIICLGGYVLHPKPALKVASPAPTISATVIV